MNYELSDPKLHQLPELTVSTGSEAVRWWTNEWPGIGAVVYAEVRGHRVIHDFSH